MCMVVVNNEMEHGEGVHVTLIDIPSSFNGELQRVPPRFYTRDDVAIDGPAPAYLVHII